MIEVLVVIFVILLVAVILLPVLAASKRKSSRINCINNVKQVALSFRVWEGDNNDKFPMQFAITNSDTMKLIGGGNAYVLWQTMSNELSTPKVLHCPDDTNHIAATDFGIGFSDANISYFVNLDANEANPQTMLMGDDNLAVGGVPVKPGILNLATNAPVTWTAARHKFAGNFALTDGSVQQATSAGLTAAVASSAATNQPVIRLVIP